MKVLGRILVSASAARRIRIYLVALWKLFRHPETPRAARWVAFAVIAYAVSPIDLIPDFIPVLGQIDDMIIVPLGIALAVRLCPRPLWDSLLREAEASAEKLPRFWWGAVAVVLVWAGFLALGVWAWRAW
ncbi:MAG TPA: YkvA family protein [Caldimonas sp.]